MIDTSRIVLFAVWLLKLVLLCLQDCVFDACAFGDARVSLENNVGAYAKACQDLGVQICPTWRKEANIRMNYDSIVIIALLIIDIFCVLTANANEF